MQLHRQPDVNERSITSNRGKLASIYAGRVLPPQLQAEEAPDDGFNSPSFGRRQWIIAVRRAPTVQLQARSRNIDHTQSTVYPELQQNIGELSNYRTVFHILSQGHRRADCRSFPEASEEGGYKMLAFMLHFSGNKEQSIQMESFKRFSCVEKANSLVLLCPTADVLNISDAQKHPD